MSNVSYEHVTGRTRAGQDGKVIFCPICDHPERVYNFSWSAMQCSNCKNAVEKFEWFVMSKANNSRKPTASDDSKKPIANVASNDKKKPMADNGTSIDDRTSIDDLPSVVRREIFRTIPAQNIEIWPKVSNCGYFLRSAFPFTAMQLSRNKAAYTALQHSVLQSLKIFKERVSRLRMYGNGRNIIHIQDMPCYPHCHVPVKADIDIAISHCRGKFGISIIMREYNLMQVETMIRACKNITIWKDKLRAIDSQVMSYFNILDRFHQTQNVGEFEAAVLKAKMRLSVKDARRFYPFRMDIYNAEKLDALHDHQLLPEILRPIEMI